MTHTLLSNIILSIIILLTILMQVSIAAPLETQDRLCVGGSATIVLMVDPQLKDQIQNGLTQFAEDLCNDNYTVIERISDFTTPPEVRNYLSEIYAVTGEQLEGVIFIGSIPWVYQNVIPGSDPQSSGYEVISFQYYSDLDGVFSTSPGYTSYYNYDYSFDLHTGDVDWEIWCSNLPYYKDDIGITIEAINRYFEKNHDYRVGNYNYQSNFLQIEELHHADNIEQHNQILGWMESGIYSWTPLCNSLNAQLFFDTSFNGLSLEEGYKVLSQGTASFTCQGTHGWIGGSGDLLIEWVETNPVKTTFFWSSGCSVGNLDYTDLWLRSVVYSPTSDVLFAYGSTGSSGGLGDNTDGHYGHNIATYLSNGGNFGNALLSHINVPLVYPFDDSREFHFAQPVFIGDPTLKLPSITSLNIKETESLPGMLQLLPAYPNPFNPSTTIRYSLDTDSYVTVEIYNIIGKLISTLQSKNQTQGWHSVIWNGTNQQGTQVPAGLYLSKITSGNAIKTSKLMLLK